MKKKIALILIITFVISCSKKDDLNVSTSENQCKILGTNGYLEVHSDLNIETFLTYTGDTIYNIEYIYNDQNKLSERFDRNSYNHNDIIEYDSQGRINLISKYFTSSLYTSKKQREYDGLNTLASIIKRYRINDDNSTQLTYTENLTYNTSNQLSKVLKSYNNSTKNNIETNYLYNNEGNLSEIKTFSIADTIKLYSIETYENYDTNRNPYKDLPFDNLRGFSESNNRYTKSTTIVYDIESDTPNAFSEYSEYSITDLSLLPLSKYQCD